MKIYQKEPAELYRVNIKMAGCKTEHITFCETTQQEVYDVMERIVFTQRVAPSLNKKRITIEIRKAKGGKNEKSISLSFVGLFPEEIKILVLKEFDTKEAPCLTR